MSLRRCGNILLKGVKTRFVLQGMIGFELLIIVIQ